MKLVTKTETKKNTPHSYLIPPIIVMGFIPLIVCYYQFDSMMEQFNWYPDSAATQADVYLAVKAIAIIIMASIMVLMLLYKHFAEYEELPWKKLFWLPVGFGILVFLSSIVSRYRAFAFGNSVNRFEGVFVVLSYLVIAYYTYSVVKTEDDFWYILKGVSIFVLIEYLICIFQGFGLDFMMSPIGKMMQLPPSRWSELSAVSKSLADNQIYGTLYTTDFAQIYFGLFLPIYPTAAIASKGKKRIPWIVMSALSIVLFIMDTRRRLDSLPVAVLGGLIIVLLILAWRNKQIFISFIALICVGLIVITSVGSIRAKIDSFLKGGISDDSKDYLVKGIYTNDDEVVFRLRGDKELHLTYEVDESGQTFGENLKPMTVHVTDADGNELSATLTDEASQTYTLDSQDYGIVQFGEQANKTGTIVLDDKPDTAAEPDSSTDITNLYMLNVTLDGKVWQFTRYYRNDDGYFYFNDAKKYVKIDKDDSRMVSLFPLSVFSGRGAIYNRTLPLLKHTVIFGTGSSTFMCAFQNNGNIFKKYYGVYVAKAHSFYLGSMVENGWIATVLLLIFFIAVIVIGARILANCSFKGLLKKENKADGQDNGISAIYLGLYASFIIYLIIVLVNDSMTVTAPVFWTILGLLMAFTSLMKKVPPVNKK